MAGGQHREHWSQQLSRVTKWFLLRLLKISIIVGTIFYYRLFYYNTTKPIRQIAAYASHSGDQDKVLHLLIRWRRRKLAELQFVSIACAILAAAVIGCFSWNTVASSYWLASALWYCSLLFSMVGLLLGAQQAAVLDLLGEPREHSDPHITTIDLNRYLPLMLRVRRARTSSGIPEIGGPRWKMIFIWQCPVMFMSWSAGLFYMGLVILVCSPLIQRSQSDAELIVAVIFLSVSAVTGVVFAFVSFWVYHYIDLETELDIMGPIDSETKKDVSIWDSVMRK